MCVQKLNDEMRKKLPQYECVWREIGDYECAFLVVILFFVN